MTTSQSTSKPVKRGGAPTVRRSSTPSSEPASEAASPDVQPEPVPVQEVLTRRADGHETVVRVRAADPDAARTAAVQTGAPEDQVVDVHTPAADPGAQP